MEKRITVAEAFGLVRPHQELHVYIAERFNRPAHHLGLHFHRWIDNSRYLILQWREIVAQDRTTVLTLPQTLRND